MVVMADPGNQAANVLLSALIHGLYEKQALVLVRYCRTDNAPPKIGIMKPHITSENECLYFCQVRDAFLLDT
jgi:ATP-dependent DNA helicase 2 subunit 2